MPQPFKVHELLERSELDELEAFARKPGVTVDACHEWMQARGFTLSRGAAGNWLREFKSLLLQERFSGSAELAKSIKAALGAGQLQDVADAAAMQLTQVVFEQAAQLQAEGTISPKDMVNMTGALKNLVTGKRHIEKLKTEVAAALSAAEKSARGAGAGGGEAVISEVRKILGIDAKTP
jgi:hypothetical protein